ncbi:MAG TPA: anti-sigma regulatory factor [Candidatus Acidoferrales bacterium]|jgi:serine/threonine-protein kinase RsbT|nr:anti-sigma regulatory factor [Candidatus Acidoferrales bacterium]
MENEARVAINSAADIVTARQKGRTLATELGFDGSDLTLIATAISEVARNIVTHAKSGEILLVAANNGSKHGITIIARDEGPGIKDINRAMQYGYSTAKGLGVGLPGAKWLMDEFEIESKVGNGTKVTMKKWLK